MLPNRSGSIPFFRLFGISVSIHWLWFVLVYIAVHFSQRYTVRTWALFEYLSLFAIVLLHEFGHALACRSVGGRADRIVLWPLGGVAFVQPPPRPGATLWSIAAGPLVNVLLIPVTFGAYAWASSTAGQQLSDDAVMFIRSVAAINLVLLVFNMLPIYPLDGGQIVQSILWFFIGRSRSLRVCAIVGMVVGATAGVAALFKNDIWMIVLAFFVVSRAWNGYKVARMMAAYEAHTGVRL